MTTFEIIGSVSILINLFGIPSALIWIVKVEKCLTEIKTTCRLRSGGDCNMQGKE